jgi:signal transduction histidine kinase
MREERIGLLLLGLFLLVVVCITGIVAHLEVEERREHTREQGLSLVRLLTKLPLAQLTGDESGGPLHVVRHSLGRAEFAYAVVAEPDGAPLAEVTAPGVIAPREVFPSEPARWLGERVLTLGESEIHEFHGPLLEEGRLVAQVRLGLQRPELWIVGRNAPLVGLVALLVFSLAVAPYFLLRREIRPLARVNQEIQAAVAGARARPIELELGGELGRFVESFNRFVSLSERRMLELKTQHAGLIAESSVKAYQRSRVENVIESLPDGALALDETGTAMLANGKIRGLLGADPAEVLGRKPAEWCGNAELVGFLEDCVSFAGPPAGGIELELASGRRISASGHPLQGQGRRAAGALVLIRDATGDALTRAAPADFMSHVAHELKSPLNLFSLYGEALLGKDGESEVFRIEAANAILDEVERLRVLIDTLLSIARLESGAVTIDRQRVKASDFLRDVLETAERGAKRSGLRFALEIPAELPPLRVDKDLLRIALNNLLTNAVKYNRDGGSVTLSAESTPSGVTIRVRDTGIGIRTEDRPRVFEKFFRASDAASRSGHGLGLALAQQIARLHGAELTVESREGQGSEFSLALERHNLAGDGVLIS